MTMLAAKSTITPSAAENLPDARASSLPRDVTRPADLHPGHGMFATQIRRAGADLRDDQVTAGTHVPGVVSNPCADQRPAEAQERRVGAQLNGHHGHADTQTASVAVELLFCAAFLDDCERIRIATENRLRAMRETGLDVRVYEQQAEALAKIEHQATLALQRAMRRHPLGPWVARTIGLGEKQTARLIASIGLITWNTLEDRPRRGPAELWAYCGYVPGQRRRKGERSNWSTEAKMRAYLCAESCIKQRESPYRMVYDASRIKHAEATHDEPCAQCGPKGTPAPTGSPLSDGHKHTRALREVAKRILRDMFLEAKRAETLT
jgi:hypothetical protein